jgi:hypothetical protein
MGDCQILTPRYYRYCGSSPRQMFGVCRPRSVLVVELSEQVMLRNLRLWIVLQACQSGRRSMMAVTELRAVVHYFPLHTFFI